MAYEVRNAGMFRWALLVLVVALWACDSSSGGDAGRSDGGARHDAALSDAGDAATACEHADGVDCAGQCGGSATVDDCGVCAGENADKDCEGVCFGDVVADCLGVCGGTAQADCAGVCEGTAALDCAGQCDGDDHGVFHYADDDDDGTGEFTSREQACVVPAGRVTSGTDCDDRLFGCRTDCAACVVRLSLPAGIKLTATELGQALPAGGVAALGDVNNDDVMDLVIGDRIVFMNANGSVQLVRQLTASDLGVGSLSASFGHAVAPLGDIDDNGTPDVAISEPQFGNSDPQAADFEDGRVWVLRLQPDGSVMQAEPHLFMPGDQCRAHRFGTSLASADIDGDGSRELLATTRTCTDQFFYDFAGQIAVLTLASDGSASATGNIDNTQVPYSYTFDAATIAVLPDIDGNDTLDLAIAMSGDQTLWTVLLETPDTVMGVERIDESEFASAVGATEVGGALGESVASLGDIDGDGSPEVAVGYGRLAGEGGLMLLSLADDGLLAGFTPVAERFESLAIALSDGDAFGASIAALGDFDGDGVPELSVRAPGDDEAGSEAGALWLLGFETDCGAGLRGDCNANALDRCETELVSAEHCGACGRECAGRPHSSAGSCDDAGTCTLTCDAGFADCNGLPEDGCELEESGASYAQVTGTACNAGSVTLTCAGGFGDCDDDFENGCETNSQSDPQHCGECANACPIVLGREPTCDTGSCGSSAECAEVWSDCDSNTANGCEACGVACDQDQSTPGPVPAVCDGDETCVLRQFRFDLQVVPYAECVPSCPQGFADCNGEMGDGCERNITTEASCGDCFTSCPIWNTRLYCAIDAAGDGYACR